MKKLFFLLITACFFIFEGCALNNEKANETAADYEPSPLPIVTVTPKPTKKPSPSPVSSESPSPAPEKAKNEDLTEIKEVFDPYEIINSMSDEELVGQLFLARAPDLSSAVEKAKEYHLGGYVLFSNHTENESPQSLSEYIGKIQAESKIPLLIGVDEEGGSVTRLSRHSQYRSENFPSPKTLYSEGGTENLLNAEKEKCDLLKKLGFNLNLAPVCDITTDPEAFMYSRSLGLDAETTGEVISEVIKLYKDENVGAVLKHFPGYGNNKDTHTGIAVDERSLNELILCDLVPFFRGIRLKCDGIMVSHTFINALDETTPASLSKKVMSFLREEMKFNGVILTDDLVMEAITDLYGAGESAVLALEAGADLLCSTEIEIQYEAVLSALKEGRIERENLEKSAARILYFKHKLNLLN